tara:strand:- start:39 stop:269 length:231 start_codon:yes stop_codon:yes gene_type:complete
MKLELKGRDTELVLAVMEAYIRGVTLNLTDAGKKRLAHIEAKQIDKFFGYDIYKERTKDNLEALNGKEETETLPNS